MTTDDIDRLLTAARSALSAMTNLTLAEDEGNEDLREAIDLVREAEAPLRAALLDAADPAPTDPDGPCEGCGWSAETCIDLGDDRVCCILCTHIHPASTVVLDMPGPDTTEGGR